MKKLIRLLLIFFVSCQIAGMHHFSLPAQARNYLVTTDSEIMIQAATNNLGIITPQSEIIYTELTITYEYDRFARPEGFPIPSRQQPTMIKLQIEKKPAWCDIELAKDTFEASVTTFFQGKTQNFTTTFKTWITSEDAPAFTTGEITINASANHNGNIQPATTKYTLTIQPDFIPLISSWLSNTTLTIKTSEEKTLTITVKNQGNARITAAIEANTTAEALFQIALPQAKTIAVDDEAIFNVTLQTNKKDVEETQIETILFTISYYATDQPNYEGAPVTLQLKAEVHEDQDEVATVDLTLFIIAIVIVFIIVYIVFTIITIRRRKYT